MPSSHDLRALFGFTWDPGALPASLPMHSPRRACFRLLKLLPEFVWDAGALEGNPITFPEVQTLLDGITVGGRKLSDQQQILNLAASHRHLVHLVQTGRFALSKDVFCQLHALVAREEALEWGVFRGEGEEVHFTPEVSLGPWGRHTPLPTLPGAPELNRIFAKAVSVLPTLPPLERALVFFLFASLQQFFFDGNKRTARLMMNGILMSHGMDAISVPAARAQEFHQQMITFYRTREATAAMAFLVSCHPDAPGGGLPAPHCPAEP